MNIKRLVSVAISTVRELSVTELVRYAHVYLYALLAHRRDRYDDIYGTDTTEAVAASNLDGVGGHAKSAQMYWVTNVDDFARLMKAIDTALGDFTFVDLGCGKARTLLLACDYPFERILGVEFSKKLCDIAEKNISIFRTRRPDAPPMEVYCLDAADYKFPLTPLIVYMFDPFGHDVMEGVVSNLRVSLKQHPRPCYVAYCLPLQGDVFENNGFSVIAKHSTVFSIRYPWVLYKAD